MAKDQPGPAQLVHHYTHVVCALSEARKNVSAPFDCANAIDNTIVGVCKLIDSLVTQEHMDMVKVGAH